MKLGCWHYQSDLQNFNSSVNEQERVIHSHYELFWAHGMMLFGNTLQATQHAMNRIGYTLEEARLVDPQLWLEFEAAIARTKKNCSP
jgi:hypothetical protein